MPLLQMNPKDNLADRRRRKIYKENLIQTPFANQLRRQTLDVVGRGHINTLLVFSAIQVSKVPSARRPPSLSPAFFNFIDP